MEEHIQISRPRKLSLENIPYFVIGVIALIIPFFYIPSIFVGITLSKALLFSVGVITALAFYIITVIKSGKIEAPKNLVSLSIFLVPVAFLISALAHGGNQISLLGFVFETGTVAFVSFGFVLLFLVGQVFRSKEKIFYSYFGFFAAFFLLVLFHIIRFIFGVDTLSFGVFSSQASNLLGNWNDLGIFFGAGAILSLVTLEMVDLNKIFKILVYKVFVLSIIFLSIINFNTVWVVVGVFSLVIFLYFISFVQFARGQVGGGGETQDQNIETREVPIQIKHSRKISYNALATLVISVVFIFAGQQLGDKISGFLNIASVEVRPSFATTFEVAGNALQENLLLGSGPNNFTDSWLKFKPDGINDTIFWNTDFSFGIGYLPTFVTTTGILGASAWLFFLLMFVIVGIKAIFQPIRDLFSKYLITSSFLVSLFFWIMTFFYVLGTANLVMAFFFTGLFLAALYRENLLKSSNVSITKHPKISFLSVLVLITVLIGDVVLGYVVIQKSISFVSFQKGLFAINQEQNINKADEYFARAVNLGNYDVYYRSQSDTKLAKANEIINREVAGPDSVINEFQQVLAQSIDSATRSTEINPTNYQNWLSLARVFASLVPAPLSVPGAYENALQAYNRALELNPKSPAIYLLLARLEVDNNSLDKAKEFAAKATELKQDYADAHFLISQIEVTQGNLAQSVPSLERTLLLAPNNPGLFFQLGVLKYNLKDYAGAADALQRATSLVPDYA
ncbi:MAG: hypothetical protein COV95_01710, partial [Candidatus Zambryskibacteria bacterium CG11_big_fil_rev_8_21_14_0_20_40_24]